jgi:RNA polymerase sigma factor (sigma-70 family)
MNIPSQYKELSDLDLWRLFLQGDGQVFALIFDTYSDMLYRYGCAITPHTEVVEDSIQDIFIELWHTRTRLKDTDNIRYYLFKVLRRKIYRNLDVRVDLMDNFNHIDFESQESIETLIIDIENQTQRLETLKKILIQLPRRQREVIELRFYQGFSYEQIADITEINLQSVHNNMHRALTALRQKLPSDLFILLLSMTPSVLGGV